MSINLTDIVNGQVQKASNSGSGILPTLGNYFGIPAFWNITKEVISAKDKSKGLLNQNGKKKTHKKAKTGGVRRKTSAKRGKSGNKSRSRKG